MKNKKLFAILTLVCFMFTLMPVAAFAAPTDFSATASVVATQKANQEVEIYDEVDAQITLKAVNNSLFYADANKAVYVWAETAANQISDAFAVKGLTAEANTPGVYKVTVAEEKAVAEFKVEFYRAGNYTLKAAVENPALAEDIEDIITFNGASAAFQTVKVASKAADTKTWGVYVEELDEVLTDEERTSEDKIYVEQANGVKTETVTLTVLTNEGEGQPVAGYPVKLDTNSSNIEISEESLTTNHNGEVEFKVGGTREGIYKVYVTVGELEVTVLVQVGSWISDSIEVIKAPEAPVAKDTGIASYEDLIRFQITDVNGNIVTDAWDYCTESNPDEDAAPYVTFVEKPAASKLKDKDLWIELAYDYDNDEYENYYVLALTDGKNFDVEGTYTVKVILDNGRSATVTWEVKKFQTPVALVIDAPETVELGAIVEIDMTYVDANGVEKLAEKDADLTATGYAIAAFEAEDEAGMLMVKTDEKYVGSTITVTAVSERYNLVAVEEIKVAGEAKEIKFEEDSLAVNAYNKVKWNVVDENGNPVKLTDYGFGYASNRNDADVTIRYVVLDKPADAKVSVTDLTDKAPFDGDGVMALTSNKVGNVTVQAVAQVRFGVLMNGNDNVAMQTKYYTGTQIFAVGTEGVGDVVVMSVGSNEIVINDKTAVIDAAPIVENNRTFVPFRALAEAFGATVAYDEATQAVTAELNGVKVVMTIGSATYTVNDVEKTADVAPFINGSRTMVPVRFAAEAFGIKVIPTYDENGATADILFNL